MSYPGSKAQAGVWQRIIGQMPPHSVYVEAFFGSGQVFQRKRAAKISVLIDQDRLCIEPFCENGVMPNDPATWTIIIAVPGVMTLNGNALEWLLKISGQLGEDAVIYCDPPYPLSTRAGRRCYQHEMSDDEHVELLRVLNGLKCRVLLSGVPCELYDSRLQHWRCIRYRTRWHTKTVTECLWCNFPEPEELHDWRYAGANRRQRLSLKRLRGRWLAKLANMKPRQRGYVLAAIREIYAT